MRKNLFILFAFFCVLNSCNVEDSVIKEQNSSVAETSKWFNESGVNLPVLQYSKPINWQDAIVSERETETIIEVPILLNDKLKVQNDNTQTYNRLVFIKDKEGKFQVYHLVLSTSKEFDNEDKNLTFDRLITLFDVNLNLVNEKQEVVDPVTKLPKKRFSSPTGKEEETCTYLIEMYDDGSYDLIEKLFCGGTGGGSGTGGTPPKTGGAGGSGGTTAETAPPSCQSFNFIKTASLWQVALVKNISFTIVLLDAKGAHVMHRISYPAPISFGAPTNLQKGGTTMTAGMVAELSTRALQTSIQDVVNRYGTQNVSEMAVDIYFRERLVYNYPLFVPGGRANFTASENLPATDYKTTFLFPDDCAN